MNNVDKQYFDFIRYIKEYGIEKGDRTGTGTLSVFSYEMRFKMKEGFPLLTSKKMAWKSMVIELIWFLKGDTNIKYLVDNGCYIWVGDAYKNYVNKNKFNSNPKWLKSVILENGNNGADLYTKEEFINKIKTDDEFAKIWGELGPVYGKQWRSWEKYDLTVDNDFGNGEYGGGWNTKQIDQIANLIQDLKTNPDSRRLMVNAWNPSELKEMVLPPCHYGFQCYTREMTRKERSEYYYKNGNSEGILEGSLDRPTFEENAVANKWYDERNVPKRTLSLKWIQRSVDCGLGLPFNIASYGLLLHLLAKEVNMVPDELIFSGGDCHIYLNHLEAVTKQLHKETFKLPTIEIANKPIFDITYDDIKLIDYKSSEKIDMPLSN